MHINLILETEVRSASILPLKTLIRLLIGGVAVGVLMGIASFYASYSNAQQSARAAAANWKKTDPEYQAAIRQRTELSKKNAVLKEIIGWKKARLDWAPQLEGLEAVMPEMIQLTEFRVTQVILTGSNNVPVRAFEMRLSGRTPASTAEEQVSELSRALVSQRPFKQCVEAVNLPPGAFRQDKQGKTDRVFELVCKYSQRRFE